MEDLKQQMEELAIESSESFMDNGESGVAKEVPVAAMEKSEPCMNKETLLRHHEDLRRGITDSSIKVEPTCESAEYPLGFKGALTEKNLVSINDLMDRANRIFVCRIIAPWCVRDGRLVTIVDDPEGLHAAKLAVDNYADTKDIESVYPVGTKLAIKYSGMYLVEDKELTAVCSNPAALDRVTKEDKNFQWQCDLPEMHKAEKFAAEGKNPNLPFPEAVPSEKSASGSAITPEENASDTSRLITDEINSNVALEGRSESSPKVAKTKTEFKFVMDSLFDEMSNITKSGGTVIGVSAAGEGYEIEFISKVSNSGANKLAYATKDSFAGVKKFDYASLFAERAGTGSVEFREMPCSLTRHISAVEFFAPVTELLVCDAAADSPMESIQNGFESESESTMSHPPEIIAKEWKEETDSALAQSEANQPKSKSSENEERHVSKSERKSLPPDKTYPRLGNSSDYDMKNIVTKHPTYQHRKTDFNIQLKRTNIEGKGLGLVAMESVQPGQLVIASKAFAIVFVGKEGKKTHMDKRNQFRYRLTTDALRRAKTDTRAANEIRELYAGSDYDKDRFDSSRNLDLRRIESICNHNCYSSKRTPISDTACRGLWILPSFLNHSCHDYNCDWMCHGNLLLVRAIRPIAKDEELVVSYVTTDLLKVERMKKLRDAYGFECCCRLCVLDKELPDEVQVRRREAKETEISDLPEVLERAVVQLERDLKEYPLLLAQHENLIYEFGRALFMKDQIEKGRVYLQKSYELLKLLPLPESSVLVACSMIRTYLINRPPIGREVNYWIEELKKSLRLAYGSIEVLRVVDDVTFSILRGRKLWM